VTTSCHSPRRARPPWILLLLAGLAWAPSPGLADDVTFRDRVQPEDLQPLEDEPSEDELDGYREAFAALDGDAAIAYAAEVFASNPALVPYLVEEFATDLPPLTGELFGLAEQHASEQDATIIAELREDFEARLERVFLYLDAAEDSLPPPLEYFDAPVLVNLVGDEVYLGDEDLEMPEDVAGLAAQVAILEGFGRTRRIGDYLVAHPEQMLEVTRELCELDPLRAEETLAVALEVGPDFEEQLLEMAESFSDRLERLAAISEEIVAGADPVELVAGLAEEDQVLVMAMARDQALDQELEEAMPAAPEAEAAAEVPAAQAEAELAEEVVR
jgi:hypothetical protein